MGFVMVGVGVLDLFLEKNFSDSYYCFFFLWFFYVVSELIWLWGYDF